MTPEEEQQLGENYAKYCAERDAMAAQGKALGTFSSWQFANNLVKTKIALTREEHFGRLKAEAS